MKPIRVLGRNRSMRSFADKGVMGNFKKQKPSATANGLTTQRDKKYYNEPSKWSPEPTLINGAKSEKPYE